MKPLEFTDSKELGGILKINRHAEFISASPER